jgi:NADH-quinone oxidoreductase subunit K
MPTYAYILVSLALFFVGTAGVFLRRNVLIVLMSVELQLAAGTLALLAFSRALAVGLAIVVSVFRTRRTTNLDDVNALKG